ncbi:MAG TPA: DUF6603 domain-containing protein [Trebonia sp.]
MAAGDGTLQQLAGALTQALQPLQTRLAAGDARGLLAEMGLSLPPSFDGLPAFSTAASAAVTAAENLAAPLAALATAVEGGDPAAIVTATLALLQAVAAVITALKNLAAALNSLAGSLAGVEPGDVTAFAAAFAEKLLEHVVVDYLAGYRPLLLRIAALLGIVDTDDVPPDPADPAKVAYQRRDLILANIGGLLSDPAGYLDTLYGWNTPALNAAVLLPRVRDLLTEFGVLATYDPATTTLTLLTVKVSPTTAASPPGLALILGDAIADGAVVTLPSLLPGGWTAQLVAAGALAAGVELDLLPPGQLAVHGAASVDGSLQVAVTRSGQGGQRLTVLGIPGVAAVDAAAIGTSLGAQFHWDASSGAARGAFVAGVTVTGGKLTVGAANADGFVASLLSGLDIELDFDLQLGWAGDRGFYVGGNAGLGTTIGVNATIGPFTVGSVHLELTAAGQGLVLEASVTGSGTLGPVSASVDRIGATASLGFTPGNLGPADLDLGFKPPSGLGILVDAGAVTGGGYIAFDPVKGEYSGALELSLLGLAVKAVGVLDTRLPDGTPGFSFLIILTFDLPPVQLGFGFTLNGLGGLCGINRTLVPGALQAALRARHLGSILFPPDPVADAPQIISDIQTIFPPSAGRYVFGPMLEIGWGTPTLLTLELGVILEVPDPVRIALLGSLHMALPDASAALVLIQIDIAGTLDLGAGELAIDGTVYDSYIVAFQLSGDMALRLNWGTNPDFAVSLGGFFPRYQPPPGFPALRPLTVSIGDGSDIQLSCTAYLAVTANSFQFGAAVQLYASAGGFTVQGHVGFDALLMFNPFGFDVDFTAGVDVKYDGTTLAGIELDAELTGPTPFHVHGTASLHFLFFSVGVTVDITWGDDNAVTLPAVAVLPQLNTALTTPGSWSAQLPDGAQQAVTLRGLPPGSTDIMVHPMGSLTVRENVVPLDVPVTKFGDTTPADGSQFAIASVTLGAGPAAISPVRGEFAPGQFQQLSDADKISDPAFEEFHCGVTIGDPSVRAGSDAPRTVTMQWRYVPDPVQVSVLDRFGVLSADVLDARVQTGAGARSLVRNGGLARYTNPELTSIVATSEFGYVIAGTEDLIVRDDISPAGGTTRYQAGAALAAYLASHPDEAGGLQVLPAYEVAA